MEFNLSIMMVWLFLGLGLGILGLLVILTLVNTWSAIRPATTQKRNVRPFDFGNLLPSWLRRRKPSPSSQFSNQQAQPTALLTSHLPPLACELEIKSATISTSCCLLHTKQGQPLHGGAVSTRLTRLERMGVLI